VSYCEIVFVKQGSIYFIKAHLLLPKEDTESKFSSNLPVAQEKSIFTYLTTGGGGGRYETGFVCSSSKNRRSFRMSRFVAH